MGVKDFNHNVQEFFDLCRKGSSEAVSSWIQLKTKKSKSPLNFLRPTTPSPGWLTILRDPSTCYTALHQAALHGHCEVVKLLVEQDQELVGSKDRRGCLPLHLAAWSGHAEVVEELLRADIGTLNAVNNAKECPLHLASLHGYGGVVSLLLKNHANAQLRNARFETALDIAVRIGKENICKLLLCYYPELVLQSAAECSTADNRTISAKIVYPLHSAARYGHTECISILCDAGFDVNYVTEEGSAIHVAAIFGQIESVRILLSRDVDLNIKDCNGMTVLQKLKQHESQQNTDLTQVIQSKDGWAICRQLIEESQLKTKSDDQRRLDDAVPCKYTKDIVWRTLPENSRAPDQKRTSSKCAFTTSHNNQASSSSSTSSEAKNNGYQHSHPVVRPAFPITSPNMLNRLVKAGPKRTNGFIPAGATIDQKPNPLPTCSYQAPPLYDAWTQPKPPVYNNLEDLIGGQQQPPPLLPLSYDNVPRNLFIYDNAPPPNHRRWDHDCCISHAKQPNREAKQEAVGLQPATISVVKAHPNFLKNIREDGSQTTPVKPTPSIRPSVLQVFAAPISKPSAQPQKNSSDSTSTDLLLSFASPTQLNKESSQIPSTFSSSEREADAPLALPEEMGGSTGTSSVVSISPERVVSVGFSKEYDAKERRSTTLSSNTRSTRSSSTLILDHHQGIVEEEEEENMTNGQHLEPTVHIVAQERLSDHDVISPTCTELSDNTIASSCSLQMISQISSTPPSPKDVLTIFKNQSSCKQEKGNNQMESLHARLTKGSADEGTSQLNGNGVSTKTETGGMDHSAEWRKIDDMLNEIQRDSFFTRSSEVNSSEESQPLILQLNNKAPESSIVNWLLSTGLSKPMVNGVAYVLETNGFDNVQLMKGSLTVNFMTELGFDKNIIDRLDAFITLRMKENIRSVDEFEYLSDWLDSLNLIDHLGPFARANLTFTSDILAARLMRSDLEKMGKLPLGHVARIIRSLELAFFKANIAKHPHAQNSSTCTTDLENVDSPSSGYLPISSSGNLENADERETLLLDSCVSFSAHYLGSVEISNVEGAEDCRRAMSTSKKRIKQVNKVPQVILEISVGGINILDSTTNQLTVQHEINRIQVVCQDELDLNCFAYIYQDGEKNFCHVYCVLTAGVAKDIIITLGEAFNLAYSLLNNSPPAGQAL